jgi:hypothetical protein
MCNASRLAGGFYINTSSLPPGSVWVRYISMVYWGFQVRASAAL